MIRPLLFDIFLSDLFVFLHDIPNYADIKISKTREFSWNIFTMVQRKQNEGEPWQIMTKIVSR